MEKPCAYWKEKSPISYSKGIYYIQLLGLKLQKLKIPIIMEFNGSDVRLSKEFGRLFMPEKFANFMESKILKQSDIIVTVSRV